MTYSSTAVTRAEHRYPVIGNRFGARDGGRAWKVLRARSRNAEKRFRPSLYTYRRGLYVFVLFLLFVVQSPKSR